MGVFYYFSFSNYIQLSKPNFEFLLAKSSILTHLRGLAFGDRPSPRRCVSPVVWYRSCALYNIYRYTYFSYSDSERGRSRVFSASARLTPKTIPNANDAEIIDEPPWLINGRG